MDPSSESKMLNNTAHQKLATVNPGTIASARRTNSAFITNRNNPKVTIVMGKVSTTRMGLTINCSIAITMATRMAEPKLATSIPGRSHERKNTATAERRS